VTETRPRLVLASGSKIRRQLLENAGIMFTVDAADIDERSILEPLIERRLPIPELACSLAEAKARAVSHRHPGALVIGADQMLEHDGEILHKAADVAAARKVLLRLRGTSHHLHSGFAIARDDHVIKSHVLSASLYVRDFSEAWLDRYIAANAEALTASVGAYQLEGEGIQLFERIEGDYFTILGLPLLELLGELRRLKVIET
jgi:septum formation protein